ncbi:Nodulin homeobox, partial [Thalictrum thalictroides]
ELCKNGGILLLVQAVLNLDAQHFRERSKLSASVSRMKSKVLSILLQLCEIENISYLDEVASSPRSMQVAKVVALEVLKLMKIAFRRKKQLDDSGENSFPRGLVLLNTMRLADIFSDDSNLRYFITTNTARVLAVMLLLPHEEFLSSWCSEDLQVVEEDASLDYDSFTAAGAVFALLSTGLETSNETTMECIFNLKNLPQASYAQQKTSLLVKIIANLHCFVPNICEEEERDLFFNKFLESLRMELPKSSAGFPSYSNSQNGAIVCKNLASLLDYASCLVPTFLNEDDVQLTSKFFKELQSSVTSKTEGNMGQEQDQDEKLKYSLVSDKFSNIDAGQCNQETQSEGYASSSSRKLDVKRQELPLDYRKNDYPKEGTSESLVYQDNVMMIVERNEKTETGASEPLKEVDKDPGNIETSGSEASSTRGKDSLDQLLDNGDCSKLAEHSEGKFKEVEENDKSETTNGGDKQQRKRKRNIMNDKQITLIERALLDEPEMQRNAGSLQSWADKLSAHGSELTSSQLKNWLNNRKAKLARFAKETRAPSDGENSFTDKLGGLNQGHFYDSPESPSEELYVPSTTRRGSNQGTPKGDVRLRTGSGETSEAVGIDFAAQQNIHINSMPMRYVRFERGQYVCLLDKEGKEIGKGKVYQVEGFWHGNCLEEVGTCVVDITELKVERKTRLQNPSETGGTTFEEAEIKNGVMRVAWDANNIIMLPVL